MLVDNGAPAEDMPRLARYLAAIFFAAVKSAWSVSPQCRHWKRACERRFARCL